MGRVEHISDEDQNIRVDLDIFKPHAIQGTNMTDLSMQIIFRSIYANHFQWLLFWFHVCKAVLTEYLLSFHACDSQWFPYFRCKHASSAMAWFGSCQ